MAESADSRQITAGRWQKLKAILADALEETSSSRRAELLRQACANDVELLRDAEAWLSGDTASLEQFAEWAQMHLREDLPERVGEQLGAYRIIKEIGRGGMGAVYLAERADGQFEREVALKVLKRGTDTGNKRVDLQFSPVNSSTHTKGKYLVRMPPPTGTYIGGRWKEVDNTGASVARVFKDDLNSIAVISTGVPKNTVTSVIGGTQGTFTANQLGTKPGPR